MKFFHETIGNFLVSIILFLCFFQDIQAMGAKSDNYEYRSASNSDISLLVDLLNTQALLDSDKLVIVPERFRKQYVFDNVNQGRLFVATDKNNIIGYKKLFCVTDKRECDEILEHELSCAKSDPVAHGSFNLGSASRGSRNISQELKKLFEQSVTYIYNGADFTHHNYRRQGINSALTGYTLQSAQSDILSHVLKNKSEYLALIFGITNHNAGCGDDILGGRSRGICKLFSDSLPKVAAKLEYEKPRELILGRYKAYKPSFDPQAHELKSLPQEKSVPGYGCIIAAALVPEIFPQQQSIYKSGQSMSLSGLQVNTQESLK